MLCRSGPTAAPAAAVPARRRVASAPSLPRAARAALRATLHVFRYCVWSSLCVLPFPRWARRKTVAAHSVRSPPPCGEGLGVGVAVGGDLSRNNDVPPPQPSPTRGEGAD